MFLISSAEHVDDYGMLLAWCESDSPTSGSRYQDLRVKCREFDTMMKFVQMDREAMAADRTVRDMTEEQFNAELANIASTIEDRKGYITRDKAAIADRTQQKGRGWQRDVASHESSIKDFEKAIEQSERFSHQLGSAWARRQTTAALEGGAK